MNIDDLRNRLDYEIHRIADHVIPLHATRKSNLAVEIMRTAITTGEKALAGNDELAIRKALATLQAWRY